MRCLAHKLAIVLALGGVCALTMNLGVGNAQDRQPGHGPTPGAVAGFENRSALTPDWETVEIFVVPNREVRLPNGRPLIEHVARRTSGSLAQPTWTTSRDCPALSNVMIWMTTLTPPRIEITGVTPSEFAPEGRRPLTIGRDGVETTVWGAGTQPDHVVNSGVEMRSRAGLIAEFGRAASESLARCWTATRPDMLPAGAD